MIIVVLIEIYTRTLVLLLYMQAFCQPKCAHIRMYMQAFYGRNDHRNLGHTVDRFDWCLPCGRARSAAPMRGMYKQAFLLSKCPQNMVGTHDRWAGLPSMWASQVHNSDVWNVQASFIWSKCPHETLLGHDRSIDYCLSCGRARFTALIQ